MLMLKFAAVVIPNVVGLLGNASHYEEGNGTYYQNHHKNGSIYGNWTFANDNKVYHWFFPEVTPISTSIATPIQTPKGEWRNCYCYETEEITDVLVMTIRGSDYTELRFQLGDTIRVYDEFWAAGSYSWQGEPKELGLSMGSKYYIKVRTKYQTSCNGIEERDYGCGSWRSAWNTEILEARIIPEELKK
jgi:hypothetical protein